MFDFGAKWTPAFLNPRSTNGAVTCFTVQGPSLVLVSGNIGAGLAALNLREPLGATSIAGGDAFALAMSRDRCLAVSLYPLNVMEGWHEGGYAMTEMSDGMTVLELNGSGLSALLAQATALDWSSAMRSAAISFAGVAAAAVFRESASRLWLIVETPSLPAVQRWLASAKTS